MDGPSERSAGKPITTAKAARRAKAMDGPSTFPSVFKSLTINAFRGDYFMSRVRRTQGSAEPARGETTSE